MNRLLVKDKQVSIWMENIGHMPRINNKDQCSTEGKIERKRQTDKYFVGKSLTKFK